jgi:triacylglycerol esterase/lipase EstA (alpha/beta hydrolase family)
MWTAVTLAALVVAGTLGYAAWAVHAVAGGARWWPFLLGYPLVYLAAPLVFTSVWVLLGSLLRGERPADVRLSLAQRVRLFLNEFVALAQSAPRMILYRWLMPEPPPAPADLPLLLVHGVGCNAGVWTGLRRFLDAQRLGPVYAISYGPPLASIETFADQLAARVAEVRRATGASQIVLIGHSMGGLVARAYLRKYGGAQVRKLITIGTPHQGSRLAWMMRGSAVAQMRPSSAFLAGLNGATDRAAGVPVVSLWSWHDSMVAPQVSSRLDWADNIVISGVAHNALLRDRGVWTRVADEIRKARTP